MNLEQMRKQNNFTGKVITKREIENIVLDKYN